MTFVSVREPCRGTGKRGEAAKHLSHLSLKGQSSALVRIPDSRQTSREVRKVPQAVMPPSAQLRG